MKEKEKESQSEEDGHQSKLINPNSIMSEDNSLISDNKKINR